MCSDNFPSDGACTNILNNIFQSEKFLEKNCVDVLTLKQKYLLKDDEYVDGIACHRYLSWYYLPVKEYFDLLNKDKIAFFHIVPKCLKKIISKLFRKKIYTDYFLTKSWIQALKSLNKQYDIIIAMCGGYEQIEALIKHKEKHDCKIILYQVDPCFDNVLKKDVQARSRKRFEEKIYSNSDYIVTTPLIKKRLYNENKKYQNLREIDFPNIKKQQEVNAFTFQDDKIHCVFSGRIYKVFRDPTYTLNLFKGINETKISLDLIGVDKEEVYEQIKDYENIKCYGLLPRQVANKMACGADILVNIGNSMNNQIPSKIYAYISTGIPIVNICKNREDPTIDILSVYPYSINLFEEDELFDIQVNKLKKFISETNNSKANFNYIEKIYIKNTVDYCVNQLNEVFDIMCREGKE